MFEGRRSLLRFLVDVFCPTERPTYPWTDEHVIKANAGGVAGPIRLATFAKISEAIRHRLSRKMKLPNISKPSKALLRPLGTGVGLIVVYCAM